MIKKVWNFLVATPWRKFRAWRDRLDRVPGEWEAEIAALKPTYPGRNSLQSILDSGSGTPSVPSIAENANLDAQRVFEFLGASLQDSAEPLTLGWLSRHWADLFLLAGVALLAMLPYLGAKSDARQKAAGAARAARTAREPHAVASRDLLPYAPLRPGDLEAKAAKSAVEAQKLVAGLVGRYPLKQIPAGQTIGPDLLSKQTMVLSDYSVVRVTLKLKPALEARMLPRSADLLLSNRGTPPGGEVFSIVLLDLEADGLTATVAVPNARIADAARWIGNSDAFLSVPVR
ncbi:MAG: hypothetical protein LAP87_22445 [Acidobacteriia bacterium]|nr:hypothetical protein [Terriglobia bacterium]